ncbi:hypothetical protein HBZS_114420 [Helicobacter bizzozeronii CCUG 35545]|nr:hypothetical protein HBZS_114420 [Helicobacter bizzozeronii CCUG 35545]
MWHKSTTWEWVVLQKGARHEVANNPSGISGSNPTTRIIVP